MQNLIKRIPEFKQFVAAIKEKKLPVLFSGLAGASKALLTAAVLEELKYPGTLLLVVPKPEQTTTWQMDLENLLPDRKVLVFDPAEALPFEVVAANREPTVGRLCVLASLLTDKQKPPVVIASAEALLPKLIPPSKWAQAAIFFEVGKEQDLGALAGKLVRSGYERVELVEGPGQFAIRGSILDIYPFQTKPVRVEFWGDEVSSLRELDPGSQRSGAYTEKIIIWPAREFVFDPDLVEEAGERIKKNYREAKEHLKGNRSALTRLNQRLSRFLEMLNDGVGGSLSLVQPYVYPEQVSLLDYLPEGSLVILDEPGKIYDHFKERTALLESDYRRLFQDGQSFTPWREYYFGDEELFRKLAGLCAIGFSQLLTSRTSLLEPEAVFSLAVKEMQPFFSRPDLLVSEIRDWLRNGTAVLLLTHDDVRLQQLERSLRNHELAPLVNDGWRHNLEAGRLYIGIGKLSRGFELPGRLAVITGAEIYGRNVLKRRGFARQKGETLVADLSAGDYVVHVHHGIGRYLGIRQMVVDGRKKDYLEVAFAGDDRLYVPVEQVNFIQKYIGPEGHPPRLSRLGGNEWARLKNRVKKRVQELAKDLLALYARRMETPGFAFSPDTVWQQEFEAAFPYEETPDQQRAIAEVKADMESPRPMDRLVCGDVGFGKTEVAIRAAFKAVQDGKQVAVLVPTTVLAQQHYHTFKKRFASYPVRIDVLSRFCSPREQRATLKALSEGVVDIIVGTHRLFSDDVKFKDLGLLIVDEEQRFGVSHKEKIKMLRANVDVLTLTATPIPRTLQMSLSGVRDLSMIETPPEDRLPVQTYVIEYHPDVIRDAILREIQRGGQVFYVHNRVQTIEKCAAYLQKLVPEATFRIAHGQMKEDELEDVMWEFLNREFDCLICTTIIENGLDLPNVNTLIVENADQFGLAQLYQLRGRVGRSNRLAYAYFTFMKDKVLTEQAEKRLRALQEFTEFGSGFKLALRDLEIRGAGNLLGPEQHGHMAAVGFDLYNQLLEEAVRELKKDGHAKEPSPEPRTPPSAFEIPVESYIPDDYINDPRQKIEIYRRLAISGDLSAVDSLAEEVRERFGPLPDSVIQLFDLARLRVCARELQIKVQQTDHSLIVRFENGSLPGKAELMRWSEVFERRASFSTVDGLEIRLLTRGLTPHQLVEMLGKVLIPSSLSKNIQN